MSNRDKVWYASVCFGRQRHGKVRFASARCGGVGLGMERFCFTKVTLLLFKKGEQYGRFRSMFS